MAKEPSDPSLFPWGFQRGQVPQASPGAIKPPLRPHPKPSNGTKGNQIGGSKSEGQRRWRIGRHGVAHVTGDAGKTLSLSFQSTDRSLVSSPRNRSLALSSP